MAKKKKVKAPRVDGLKYWKLRFAAEELAHQETMDKLVEKQLEIHSLEADMVRLKMNFANSLKKREKENTEEARDQYQKARKDIEKDLGFDLVNISINEKTYAVTRNKEEK